MTTNQETSLRERLLSMASCITPGGLNDAEIALMREAAEALAARAEPQAGECLRLVPEKWLRDVAVGALCADPDLIVGEFDLAAAPSPASRTRPEAQGAAAFDFCWLVELFLPYGGNSLGYYHTGFTDIGGASRSTQNPHEAKRYASLKDAQFAASKLESLQGEWRAVEHGFERAAIAALEAQASAPGGEVTEEMVRKALHFCPTDLSSPARWRWIAENLTAALAAVAPAGMDGMAIVPRHLTAENGAKAALIGEFSFRDGSGREHDVPWHVIKQIHRRVVETFAAPTPPATAGKE